MGQLLDNYQTIVKNIVGKIRDGNIVSNNSDMIDGKDAKMLFKSFAQEFNFKFHQDRIIGGLYFENNIIGIPIPIDVIHLVSIKFNDLGTVIIPEDILNNVDGNNMLYFDIQNNDNPITQYTVVYLDYISFDISGDTL